MNQPKPSGRWGFAVAAGISACIATTITWAALVTMRKDRQPEKEIE